jgi:hypothetical protein
LLLALFLGVGLAPDALGLGAIRLAGFDAYQRWAPRVRRSAPAVIVAIDEESLRLHGQWPWPRTWLARLVSLLAEANPAAIGIDLVMPEADRLSPSRVPEFIQGMDPALVRELSKLPSNDVVLAQALWGRPVVLGVAGLERDPGRPPQPLRQAPMHTIGGDPTRFVPRYEATLRSVEEIERVARGRGLLNFEAERGVVRSIPLVAAAGASCCRRSGPRSSASPPERRCSRCVSAPRASRAWVSAASSYRPSPTGACAFASREPIPRASSRRPTCSPAPLTSINSTASWS